MKDFLGVDYKDYSITSQTFFLKHVYLCRTIDAHSLATKQPSDKSIVKKEKKNYHGWENIGEKIFLLKKTKINCVNVRLCHMLKSIESMHHTCLLKISLCILSMI